MRRSAAHIKLEFGIMPKLTRESCCRSLSPKKTWLKRRAYPPLPKERAKNDDDIGKPWHVCLCAPTGKSVGTVDVMEYDWGTDAHHILAGRNSVPTGYDVVMCADCVYARASVEPLLASLCQVGDWCIWVRRNNGRHDDLAIATK